MKQKLEQGCFFKIESLDAVERTGQQSDNYHKHPCGEPWGRGSPPEEYGAVMGIKMN